MRVAAGRTQDELAAGLSQEALAARQLVVGRI